MLSVSACTGPVEVQPPDVAPGADGASTTQVCADVMADLPDTVAGKESRDTEPASDLTAAWGKPAIVLRCGVPTPEALDPTSQLITVNGVDWFPEELTGGYLFTSYGRTTNIEVTVPADYSPEIGPVTELSEAVASADPLTIDPDQ